MMTSIEIRNCFHKTKSQDVRYLVPGSVIAITNETGTLREQMAYDSWGKRRTLNGAPVNGTSTPDNLDGVTDNKGYTGHEMLDQLVARMMSAAP